MMSVDKQARDEKMIFNPYNNQNTEITETEVRNLLQQYGVPTEKIYNLELYKRAFVHKSYVKKPKIENERNNVVIEDRPSDCIPLKTKSNERLEFLGDSVLENVVRFYIYKRFPKEDEGFMTEKKISIVKNEHLGKLTKMIGLHKWFIISRHAEEKNTRNNLKKLGCLFEAFIGAIFLDFNRVKVEDENGWYDKFHSGPGYQMAEIFINSTLERFVNWTELIEEDNNFKNILQVKIQKEFKVTPTYMIINETEDSYHMGVYLIMNENWTNLDPNDASPIEDLEKVIQDIQNIRQEVKEFDEQSDTSETEEEQTTLMHRLNTVRCFIYLGEGENKIKKKAEQSACQVALKNISNYI
jgi:dsRNA-specific ribonuclease